MTERGRGALRRDADTLSIGPSRLSWEDGALVVAFEEMTAPLPYRLRGTVRLYPEVLPGRVFDLDPEGRHRWRPIAPRARVEVDLASPVGGWRGQAYFDTNCGDEPLEDRFSSWDWARAHRSRDTLIFYDVDRRDGGATNLALRIDASGEVENIPAPARAALPRTFWRLPRLSRGDAQSRRRLEDTPFYARDLLHGCYDGEPADIVHESLSLDRLRSPIVRAMLPFRMPRAFGR